MCDSGSWTPGWLRASETALRAAVACSALAAAAPAAVGGGASGGHGGKGMVESSRSGGGGGAGAMELVAATRGSRQRQPTTQQQRVRQKGHAQHPSLLRFRLGFTVRRSICIKLRPHRYDLRYHITGASDDNPVTYFQSQPMNLIGVVECCVAYRNTRYQYWL